MPREVATSTRDIHIFSVGGVDLAYDGASGALHRLDPVGREVLRWVDSRKDEALGWLTDRGAPSSLVRELVPRFPLGEVAETWAELADLLGKTVYAEDPIADEGPVDDGPRSKATGLKAMCLDVAHDCDLVCEYCFASQGRFGGRPRLMSPEGARQAVDFLFSASGDRKYLDVDFFGGEPLLAFGAVKEAVIHAKRQGRRHGKEVRFTLTTNCTLLDEDKLAFLNKEGVSLIMSVDGRPEVHDGMRKRRDGGPTHAAVLDRARRAAESRGGRDYWLRGTYTRRNLDFDADVRYLYNAGFRRISLEPAVSEARGGPDAPWAISEEDLPRMRRSYESLARFWVLRAEERDPFEFYHFDLGLEGGLCRERRVTGCGAGYEYVAVTPEGNVYPCHQLVGKRDYLLGTVFSGIERPDLTARFRQARVPYKTTCRRCWARYLCGGGCHARALLGGLDLNEPDPLSCQVIETRLECALFAQAMIRGWQEISY